MQDFTHKDNIYKTRSTTIQEELRSYFLTIYTLMSIALAITAITALATFSIPILTHLMFNLSPESDLISITAIGWLVTFAPLGISLYFAFEFNKINVQNAQILLWIYAILMGMSFASLGFVYTGLSIVKTFFICSGMFASMSFYGYVTKKDLTSLGSFLFMGLIGLIFALFTNLFLQSPGVDFALSCFAILVFIGLIAFDTQKLKELYYQGAYGSKKLSIIAAFTLYLDFINLFIYLLRFVGTRKRKNN